MLESDAKMKEEGTSDFVDPKPLTSKATTKKEKTKKTDQTKSKPKAKTKSKKATKTGAKLKKTNQKSKNKSSKETKSNSDSENVQDENKQKQKSKGKVTKAKKKVVDFENAQDENMHSQTSAKGTKDNQEETPMKKKRGRKKGSASKSKKIKLDSLDVNGGGRWTREEDQLLRDAVEKTGARNWKRISIEFLSGNRSDVQCLHRWQKVLRPGLIKGPWTQEEDDTILRAIKSGMTKWSEIANQIPGRIGKQCRERWFNHLDPSIKKCAWSPEEDKILVETQRIVGNRWCEIAKKLPGRSENSIKNRWNSAMRKKHQQSTDESSAVDKVLLPNNESSAEKKPKMVRRNSVIEARAKMAAHGVEVSPVANNENMEIYTLLLQYKTFKEELSKSPEFESITLSGANRRKLHSLAVAHVSRVRDVPGKFDMQNFWKELYQEYLEIKKNEPVKPATLKKAKDPKKTKKKIKKEKDAAMFNSISIPENAIKNDLLTDIMPISVTLPETDSKNMKLKKVECFRPASVDTFSSMDSFLSPGGFNSLPTPTWGSFGITPTNIGLTPTNFFSNMLIESASPVNMSMNMAVSPQQLFKIPNAPEDGDFMMNSSLILEGDPFKGFVSP